MDTKLLGEVCFVGDLFLFLFFFRSYVKRDRTEAESEKKESFLDAGIHQILTFFRQKNLCSMKKERLEKLRKIYIGEEEEAIYYAFYGKLGKYYAAAVLIGLCLVSCSVFIQQKQYLFRDYFLEREDTGGKQRNYSIQADSGEESKKLTVQLPSRKYTKKEAKEAIGAVEKKLETLYLGENTSEKKITKRLHLVEKIPGYEVTIRWVIPPGSVISEDGSLNLSKLEEVEQTEIKAVLTCETLKKTFARTVLVYPQDKRKRSFWEKWEEEYQRNEEHSNTKKYVKLPEKVDGKRMRYEEESISYPYLLFGGLFGLCLFIPLLTESRLRSRMGKRREQLLLDYPEFMEHFVLLIGAGLNVKGAWERIVKEYQKRKVFGKEHAVYEEMAVTIREIDNGMNEARAYELFGRRTELLQYMKFCTLLVQNLKKGSSDLLQLLEYEMTDSFKARKENAKTLGEKAGTKLLMPMAMMLVIVFVLILYAAFQNI